MTIYFPNGNYGPVCDIIPDTTIQPIIPIITVDPPVGDSAILDPIPFKVPFPNLCKTVTTTQKYQPDGPYGPVCDIDGSGNGAPASYECPLPPTSQTPLIVCPPPIVDLTDVIGDPGKGGPSLVCVDLADGSQYCFDPRLDTGCSLDGAEDMESISDDIHLLASRCGGFTDIGDATRGTPTETFPTLICGSIQRYSSPGVYEHTTPTGINFMNVTLIGAGGGAGGGDACRFNSSISAQAAGRGNNSGGTGSMMRLTIAMDPSRQNKITSIVGAGGHSGLHFTNERTPKDKPLNGGGVGGHPGPTGRSGGGGYGGGCTQIYLNNQLVASVGGGGGGGGNGCNWFSDHPNYYHKNVLVFATGGAGGLDNYPVGPPGKVLVGAGYGGGPGADDDPEFGKFGGGAGYKWDTGSFRNANTVEPFGGGGGHGVTLDGNPSSNGATTSSASGAAGGAYGGGGGGNAPGGSGGAGGAGVVRIKYGSTSLEYSTPGTYTTVVPAGVTTLTEVVCISGGGSGHKDSSGDDEGGGGGGGAYAYDRNIPVTPGATLTVVVGAGGATRTSHGSNNGGPSYVKSSSDVDGVDPGPWANWQNARLEGTVASPIAKNDVPDNEYYGLLKDIIPKFTNPPLLPVNKPHPLWSQYFRNNAVWVNEGEPNFYGQILDIRLNLDLPVAGTHTIKLMCDNKMAVYLAPWNDTGATTYVDSARFYNGDPADGGNENYPSLPEINPDDINPWPSTITAQRTYDGTTNGADSGATGWTKIAQDDNTFGNNVPSATTFSVPTAGRYVFRFLLYNNESDGASWNDNPAGMAVKILDPTDKLIWDTQKYYNGGPGSGVEYNDGGGGGGGGGVCGRGGITWADLFLSNTSCQAGDSTGFGGSSGKTYFIDHPAVLTTYFNAAPAGFHAGYQRPSTGDASFRNGGGGYGTGMPVRWSMIHAGVEYPLYNSSGSSYDVQIPGFGQNVWTDLMSGKEFNYHYAFGKYGGNPTLDPALQTLAKGTYEPARNTTIRQDQSYYEPRAFELSLSINPVKIGSNWTTNFRLLGVPPWARGSGWAVGDTMTAYFPSAKKDGNQPWIDMSSNHGHDQWQQMNDGSPGDGERRHWTYANEEVTGSAELVRAGTRLGPSGGAAPFETFQIKVTAVNTNNASDIRGGKGDAGHVRFQYGYALAAASVGTVEGNPITQESTIPDTYFSPNDNADELTGT